MIYLDNAATSWPKPECVYEAVTNYMRENGASPGRGNYRRAVEADKLVYRTRKALAKLLGAKRPGSIIFTCSATEAINLALKGFLRQGDHVLTSAYEHNAMWRPLKMLEQDIDVTIQVVPSSPDGQMDLDGLEQGLRVGARLVAVAHGSNVLGCISPLEEICEIAHRYDAVVLADASQTAGAYPLDVSKWGVDMLAFTGHKALLGPTGTGGLYLAPGIALRTVKEGGTGSMSASAFMPEEIPDRFEAGTMNIAGIAGLCASVEFLLETGVENIRCHEISLVQMLTDELKTVSGVICYGPADAEYDVRLGLLSFNLAERDPQKIARRLDDDFGIMVRAGLHCAPQAHRLLGTENIGTIRAGISLFNTQSDISALADAMRQLV